MKSKIKNILQGLLWILIVAAIGYGAYYFSEQHRQSLCKGISVTIYENDGEPLTDSKEVTSVVQTSIDSITKTPLKDLALKDIEQALYLNPVIEEVDVYTGMNGKLNIKVKTFQPLVRIITANGQSFYIEQSGRLVPTVLGHSSHVLFASGYLNITLPDSVVDKNYQINTLNSFPVLKEIFILANQISTDSFLSAQIDQVYVNADNEFELIPKIGDQVILLGDLTNLERKMKKLEAFYKQAIPVNGWNKYKSINLKFKDQVVCSKI